MIELLDANVLIALTVDDHVHHELTSDWFAGRSDGFATCPLTQGALVRHLLRTGAGAAQAIDVVDAVSNHAQHTFWSDDLGYAEVDMRAVVGHRQVTDAYLAALARARGGRLRTLDRGLAAVHADVAVLLEAV